MPTSRLFQICYSAATRDALESMLTDISESEKPWDPWNEINVHRYPLMAIA